MLRKAGNFLRYLFGILMMLAGAGYWKEEKAYALSLLLLGIFLLPVTWNTIKKRFHVAKALPVLLPVKKCETFPELFHISLLFPVPFPEAAPQQPVCLLVYLLVCLHVVPLLDRCFYKPWKNTGDPESHALSPHIPDAFPHLR